MGRPRLTFTDEQKAKIEEMALNNCHIDTIGLALGIAKNTLIRHFGTFIKQKRAEHRTELRKAQYEKATIGKDAGLLIFLGKNELDQTDKQVVETQTLAPAPLTADEVAELKRMATLATNLKLRKGA